MSAALRRVLVVGAGSIGDRHLRCFQKTGRAEVSFVEVRESLRNEIAERYPGSHPFASFEVALEQPFDAAVVATPAPLHLPQARALVERGAHVLIEKPLSVSADGTKELAAEAIARQRVIGVAYVYRAHPVLAEMREAIASGRYGKPVQLVAVCGQHFPLYRPAFRETYYTRHESGGGAVQDALTHIINAGQWLVGSIQRVTADAAHQVLEGVDVEDTVHVLARHGSVLGTYSLNQHQAPNEATITVICQRGTVRFEMHSCRWRECVQNGGEWIDHARAPLERDELFIRQASHFLDAVDGKVAPACNLADGYETLLVNRAILDSVRSGRWESIAGSLES